MTPYHLTMPESWTAGVIFSSPHSGSYYPDILLDRTVLGEREIRSSEDAYVDELFAAATRFGAPLIKATFPRAFVDLNRDCEELDPAVIKGAPASKTNPRIASGLGVIPRVVANGRSIYRGKLTLAEARMRLEDIWHPYHDQLDALIASCVAEFGEALLVDCHSMPHEALSHTNKASLRPEIVLGDRYGTTASQEFVDMAEAAFNAAGFRVARNAPFAGAFTTQRYGRPARYRHAIQVEVDRSLYMDEQTLAKRPEFDSVRHAISRAVAEIAVFCQGSSVSLAAE